MRDEFYETADYIPGGQNRTNAGEDFKLRIIRRGLELATTSLVTTSRAARLSPSKERIVAATKGKESLQTLIEIAKREGVACSLVEQAEAALRKWW